VADPRAAGEFAEIGVVLLMFGVGMHFHLKDLLAVRRIALPGAVESRVRREIDRIKKELGIRREGEPQRD
jgi:predicted Kef-type K+ transport protein